MDGRTIATDNFIACFVNTDQEPVSIKHISFLVTEIHEKGVTWLHINELIQCVYPHPDAPNDAWIQAYQIRPLGRYRPEDKEYAAAYMIFQTQQNMAVIIPPTDKKGPMNEN